MRLKEIAHSGATTALQDVLGHSGLQVPLQKGVVLP